MYGPWEIVEWEVVEDDLWEIPPKVWVRFRRIRDGNIQRVSFTKDDNGKWRVETWANYKLTYPRELKREIRNAYKLLPLIYSTEKDDVASS